MGFYGLDIYSLYSSIHEVLRYLAEVDPALAKLARERYDCLTPFVLTMVYGMYGWALVTFVVAAVTDLLDGLAARDVDDIQRRPRDPRELERDGKVPGALHCTRGIGVWDWASNDERGEPDVVLACCGDIPTLETLAAVAILREELPDLQLHRPTLEEVYLTLVREGIVDEPKRPATMRVFDRAPGLVARCPDCDDVVMRMVRTADRVLIDSAGGMVAMGSLGIGIILKEGAPNEILTTFGQTVESDGEVIQGAGNYALAIGGDGVLQLAAEYRNRGGRHDEGFGRQRLHSPVPTALEPHFAAQAYRQILGQRAVTDQAENVVEDRRLVRSKNEGEGALVAALSLP